MKPGRAVTIVNVLIVASLVAAASLGGLVVATVTGPSPTISIGSVEGVFSSGTMLLHVPVSVHDGGYLAIRDVFISLNVSDESGHQLITGSSGSFDVAAGSVKNVNLTLAADLMNIPGPEMESLLTQDQMLKLDASLKASIPSLVSVSGSVAGTLPWGALMKNLAFGQGVITSYNSTYSQISWPYSFTNSNQYFRLLATVTGIVNDQNGATVGYILPNGVEVRRGATVSGTLTAYVEDSALQSVGGQSFTAHLQIQESRLFRTTISVVLGA